MDVGYFRRLYLADEQLLQGVTSVQQLANMETELEQALERVRARKNYVSSAYQAANEMQRQQHEFLGNSLQVSSLLSLTGGYQVSFQVSPLQHRDFVV